MNGRMIRYKKPKWKNWVYETVKEDELDERVRVLESLGYIVEK